MECQATGGKVLFEVVENEQDFFFSQGFGDELQMDLVFHLRVRQQFTEALGFGPGREQKFGAERDGDAGDIEAADMGGDAPAVFRQPLHGAAGDGTFADSTDAGEDYAGLESGLTAKGAQGFAQFPAAADEVTEVELRNLAGHLIHRPLLQRLRCSGEVCDGTLYGATNEQAGGGVLGRRLILAGFVRLFDGLTGVGEGSAGQQDFAIRKVLVKLGGEVDGVGIGDRRLHGEHAGDASAEQFFGEADGGGLMLGSAMAGTEEDHGQGTTGCAERFKQLTGGDTDGFTIFAFHFEISRKTVA